MPSSGIRSDARDPPEAAALYGRGSSRTRPPVTFDAMLSNSLYRLMSWGVLAGGLSSSRWQAR